MSSQIKIAIAEDHNVFRQTFIYALKSIEGIEVVFGVPNGAELIAQLRVHPVDIVLLDLHMPIMDGKTALEVIRHEFPKVRVLILSLQYSDIHIRKFMKLGARGYLCKDVEFETVIKAIHDVQKVGYYFYDKVSPDMLAELIEDKTIDPISTPTNEELTLRELEVIQLLFEQKTNQEIAEAMNISIRTVQNHRINISRKTDSRNVVGVLIYCIKNGLLAIP